MSDTLLESQLFGHERGAFTGAHRAVKGKFELADGGTLFFDEIADMSPLAQVKVLRAVEYGEFERLGSEQLRRANTRIISATNTSLRERIRQHRFREDLFHRLAGLTLFIPPLRDRPEDLPGLIAAALASAAEHLGRRITGIRPEAMSQLLAHDWPGNLRELQHTLRSVVLLCDGPEVLTEHVQFQPDPLFREELAESSKPLRSLPVESSMTPVLPGGEPSLRSALARHIRSVFDSTGRNQRQTARLLGISRARLARHLKAMATE